MFILTGNKWRGGYLDYHRNKKEYRIQFLAWKNLERLENVYPHPGQEFGLSSLNKFGMLKQNY